MFIVHRLDFLTPLNDSLFVYFWKKRDNMVAMREIFHNYDVEAKTLVDTKDLKTEVAKK